jgi:hypothetical protein
MMAIGLCRQSLIFTAVQYRARIMVFNATFNNISVISWQSVLLVEGTGVLRENHQSAQSGYLCGATDVFT